MLSYAHGESNLDATVFMIDLKPEPTKAVFLSIRSTEVISFSLRKRVPSLKL